MAEFSFANPLGFLADDEPHWLAQKNTEKNLTEKNLSKNSIRFPSPTDEKEGPRRTPQA